jgi:metallo-beta-lactamase class B
MKLMPHRFRLIALAMLSCGPALHAAASAADIPAACAENAAWDDPVAPARIHANSWYVGTCAISAILITTDQGHVLIDGATETAAPLIERNIRALGFKVKDIRFILNSHEHRDHAGGIARLQRDSGAVVIAREPAASVLESGKNDHGDPQYGTLGGFPPISKVQRTRDGETLVLGGARMTAHATPGHTAGSTSWSWTSCESTDCRHMVYADSLSAVSADGYRFSDEAAHPGVVAAFRSSFDAVAALPCDILMTPHPGASHLLARIGPAASEALVDPAACARYADNARSKLDTRLDKEKPGVKQ